MEAGHLRQHRLLASRSVSGPTENALIEIHYQGREPKKPAKKVARKTPRHERPTRQFFNPLNFFAWGARQSY